jgi:hypothetical protein
MERCQLTQHELHPDIADLVAAEVERQVFDLDEGFEVLGQQDDHLVRDGVIGQR